MSSQNLDKWLEALGYVDSPDALHLSTEPLPAKHLYHSELHELLSPQGHIRAKAVFDVEGVPTVCFFESSDGDDHIVADVIRERIWNQNLVSIVLSVDTKKAKVLPSALREVNPAVLTLEEAHTFGEFSSADIQSGELFNRYPTWFSPEKRVDHTLLSNLGFVVNTLTNLGIEKLKAQLLMAQLMFVAYLEHRGIVGDTYRQTRAVESVFSLVRKCNHDGILQLLESLKNDFNGDLLGPASGVDGIWKQLSTDAFSVLNDFLERVDLETRQQSFWSYDFRLIPVELLSGIYETFLSDEKRLVGAYYTPRHLATLTVDQAFARSENILHERVFDGACGSGILLTTAYRRMIAVAEYENKRQLTFAERIQLLKNNIYGSDINESACRVTAFSLYLSVLEHLEPKDIVRLTEEGEAKLPHLLGSNIQAGFEAGDFFSDRNPHLQNKICTIFLSNPPWVEPKKQEVLSADTWVTKNNHHIPRRQLCAAFMLRALDSMSSSDGRLCFILPVSILAAPTSQSFVRDWIDLYEIETIINFGDLRKLLFEKAKQPTLLVVVRPRKQKKSKSLTETFDYLVPKADVSFAFGRLTLHDSDRHRLSTSLLAFDNSILTTLYWGNHSDLALLTRLQLQGSVGDLLTKEAGWITAKGFHKHDSSVKRPVPSTPLKDMQYLNARDFATDGPILHTGILNNFPNEIETVANLSEDLMKLFSGPRIVFTDGMTSERKICAGYTSKAFSFSSSLGVIKAPSKDSELLSFLAVYLHSDLVRYILLLTAYQICFERERVTLGNIKEIPFIRPENHKTPDRARKIVREISSYVSKLETLDLFSSNILHAKQKPELDKLIYEYFGVTESEQSRIIEIMNLILPSIQPSTYEALYTQLHARPQKAAIDSYQKMFLKELEEWRDAMDGNGNFTAEIMIDSNQTYGAIGIVCIDIVSCRVHKNRMSEPHVADATVSAVIARLRSMDLLPAKLRNNIYLIANFVIAIDNSLYLVKPLVQRFWLQGEAIKDAERLVRFIQGGAA